MSTPEVLDVTDLTALDRCDRCGAQAFVATDHDGTLMLWCAHHYHEHEDKLEGRKVIDSRTMIGS